MIKYIIIQITIFIMSITALQSSAQQHNSFSQLTKVAQNVASGTTCPTNITEFLKDWTTKKIGSPCATVQDYIDGYFTTCLNQLNGITPLNKQLDPNTNYCEKAELSHTEILQLYIKTMQYGEQCNASANANQLIRNCSPALSHKIITQDYNCQKIIEAIKKTKSIPTSPPLHSLNAPGSQPMSSTTTPTTTSDQCVEIDDKVFEACAGG